MVRNVSPIAHRASISSRSRRERPPMGTYSLGRKHLKRADSGSELAADGSNMDAAKHNEIKGDDEHPHHRQLRDRPPRGTYSHRRVYRKPAQSISECSEGKSRKATSTLVRNNVKNGHIANEGMNAPLIETRPEDDEDHPDNLWCTCQQSSDGEMILCDHSACTIGWFHIPCIKLTKIPGGLWFCPHCANEIAIYEPLEYDDELSGSTVDVDDVDEDTKDSDTEMADSDEEMDKEIATGDTISLTRVERRAVDHILRREPLRLTRDEWYELRHGPECWE